ncbi:hypothetical protein [Nonomuraea angiospora]|uniref:hypothetical protein n=1 Tax=Nonomuraea angiospora TaxID=46172 RepID=UPI0029B178DA|nr:hypothetical protein [Nonomuraea angiospora]MDX3107292.1 hypothetical protein [Nonomuraea angiospora]
MTCALGEAANADVLAGDFAQRTQLVGAAVEVRGGPPTMPAGVTVPRPRLLAKNRV